MVKEKQHSTLEAAMLKVMSILGRPGVHHSMGVAVPSLQGGYVTTSSPESGFPRLVN